VLLFLAFVAAACGTVSIGADNPSAVQPSASALVGDLGSKDALVAEGNKTFTKEQMLDAIALHMDYHLAAHSAAPLSGYLALLERKISLG